MQENRYMKLRIMAKKFKASIPAQMAKSLPNNLVDKLEDDEVYTFFKILDEIGLHRPRDFGPWERKH